jgi:hypothetical protein
VDNQYLDVLYQLIKKFPVQQKQKQLTSLILKLFFLIYPKQMDWSEQQRDYPKDVQI